MNFGYSDIQNVIYRQAIQAKYPGASKFAKDTAKRIWEMIEQKEPEMSKREWNLVYNFSQELEPIVTQLSKGFGFEMMRDDNAKEVYTWLKEQGKDKIAAFIKWATDAERVRYVGKYRKSPGLIKTEWKLAFTSQNAITRNADGSLNV